MVCSLICSVIMHRDLGELLFATSKDTNRVLATKEVLKAFIIKIVLAFVLGSWYRQNACQER